MSMNENQLAFKELFKTGIQIELPIQNAYLVCYNLDIEGTTESILNDENLIILEGTLKFEAKRYKNTELTIKYDQEEKLWFFSPEEILFKIKKNN